MGKIKSWQIQQQYDPTLHRILFTLAFTEEWVEPVAIQNWKDFSPDFVYKTLNHYKDWLFHIPVNAETPPDHCIYVIIKSLKKHDSPVAPDILEELYEKLAKWQASEGMDNFDYSVFSKIKSVGTSSGGRDPGVDKLPGLKERVKHPAYSNYNNNGYGDLESVIIHLNDVCKWTVNQIADWLDTLDIDLTIKSTTNGGTND